MAIKIYLNHVIDEIEKNIGYKIDIEQLAQKHFVSPRQLYRDFYSITGHSVNEYIRKRRLTRALCLLKHSEMTIVEIAHACGYSSQQALCKSVKSATGSSPTTYRISNDYFYFPASGLNREWQVTVQTETIPYMIRIKYYDTKIIGIENRAITVLQKLLPKYKGRIIGRNGQPEGNKTCYELYIEFNKIFLNDLKIAGYNIEIMPSFKKVYAKITVCNKEEEINAGWNYLSGKWLTKSMFQQDDHSYFEEYIIQNQVINRLILYLPVKKRETCYKINIDLINERLFIVSRGEGRNAEQEAAKTLTDFIVKQYPYLLTTQKEFYVHKSSGYCVCGISINKPKFVPNDGSIEILKVKSGLYAVLEGLYYNEGEYENILTEWIKENSFIMDGEPFTIYKKLSGIEKNKLCIKTYAAIKNGRIM